MGPQQKGDTKDNMIMLKKKTKLLFKKICKIEIQIKT